MHQKSARKLTKGGFSSKMKQLLLTTLLITAALTGCVSIGVIPDTGNDAIRGSYNQIAPLIDMDGSMDEAKTGQTINISIPLHSF